MTIDEQLEAARAEVARIERLKTSATCREIGSCDMQSIGGCNCGCLFSDDEGHELPGACSVPVLQCTRCGDVDYGDNDDARRVREDCAERYHR